MNRCASKKLDYVLSQTSASKHIHLVNENLYISLQSHLIRATADSNSVIGLFALNTLTAWVNRSSSICKNNISTSQNIIYHTQCILINRNTTSKTMNCHALKNDKLLYRINCLNSVTFYIKIFPNKFHISQLIQI